eukprot:7161421-Prymnesium_polylepis.1
MGPKRAAVAAAEDFAVLVGRQYQIPPQSGIDTTISGRIPLLISEAKSLIMLSGAILQVIPIQ